MLCIDSEGWAGLRVVCEKTWRAASSNLDIWTQQSWREVCKELQRLHCKLPAISAVRAPKVYLASREVRRLDVEGAHIAVLSDMLN